MEYTQLGRTGVRVSQLCLGTMNFGSQTSESDAHHIMDSAHESGINFFDTANTYGRSVRLGRTEEILGTWFGQGGGRRDRTVLATKLYGEMPFEGAPGSGWPNAGKLSAINIRRAIDASLHRLQTDRIDLLQFHHVDWNTGWDEIWQAAEVAVAQGKVVYFGSSNFAGWHIAQAQAAAQQRHFLGLVSEQSFYNLLVRDIEREVIPAAQHHGLGILPWSPLCGGLLGGIIAKQEGGVRRYEGRAKDQLESHREALTAYEKLAGELGVAPGDLALAWLRHQPAVTAPIIGPRTHDQLDAGVRAVDITLDQATLDRLDEIFPGHRTAPEDYAW